MRDYGNRGMSRQFSSTFVVQNRPHDPLLLMDYGGTAGGCSAPATWTCAGVTTPPTSKKSLPKWKIGTTDGLTPIRPEAGESVRHPLDAASVVVVISN